MWESFDDLDPDLNATVGLMLMGRWLGWKATSVQASQYFSPQRLQCIFTFRIERNFSVMAELADTPECCLDHFLALHSFGLYDLGRNCLRVAVLRKEDSDLILAFSPAKLATVHAKFGNISGLCWHDSMRWIVSPPIHTPFETASVLPGGLPSQPSFARQDHEPYGAVRPPPEKSPPQLPQQRTDFRQHLPTFLQHRANELLLVTQRPAHHHRLQKGCRQ